MDKLIPWKQLEMKVARYYPKGENGRPPYPLSAMLRVHCMQLFYNLSDPAMEDALYKIYSMRQFSGLKLDRLPDESTILKFRHFLERHGLGKVLFKELNKHLEKQGLMLREGSIVDATIISAPSSTKNRSGKRDRNVGPPDMRQTKKGSEWHFGMKMHAHWGRRHTGTDPQHRTPAANVHDIAPSGNLLNDQERRVLGDVGYLGIQKRSEHKHRKNVSWFIARRPTVWKRLDEDKLKAGKIKASIRSKVEYPFRYIEQVFGYSKVRYRGLAKYTNRLHLLPRLAIWRRLKNTYWCRGRLFSAKMAGNGQKTYKSIESCGWIT